MSKSRSAKNAFHTTLHDEIKAKYEALIAKNREVEDAEDELVGAAADSEAAEEAFEDMIRDLDGTLASLDRSNPALNARATVFPHGFSAEIEPDGDKQLAVLPALNARLQQFIGEAGMTALLGQLDAREIALKAAFDAEEAAAAKVDKLFAEESEARREVREQLDSAYGRLRDFYKGRPAFAERFFQREVRGQRDIKKKTPDPGTEAPAAGGGTP